MKIIDTHNHLYFPKFKGPLDQVLTDARAAGVQQQILIGIDELSCQAALNLASKYDDFKVALGLHPCDVDQLGVYDKQHQYLGLKNHQPPTINHLPEYFAWLDQLATAHADTVVGFGESGFDQFHRQSPELLKLQTQSFERHLQLCQKHNKTLIIHSRGARDATLDFLLHSKSKIQNLKFIWHCFTEDLAAAQTVVELGGYLGIGGVATYPKSEALRDIITQIPLEHLLTETDAPFLTPQHARKSGTKLNSPAYLGEVIQTIAEQKKIEPEACANQLYKNALAAFSGLN